MKIAIVGDTHITEYIREREDNYLNAVLLKLEYIATHNDKVIVLGDLFDRPTNSDYLFYRVYSLMKRYEGKFISILGNHDIIKHNYEQINKTTIGSLAKTGVLNVEKDSFKIDNIEFVVSLCNRDMCTVPVDETNSKILLGHNYLEMDEAESFTREEIRDLNYNFVFLGHDHKPYEDEFLGNSTLIRMGSLTRKDTQSYNEHRKIQYVQFDTELNDYEYKILPESIAKPSSEIYYEGAFKKQAKVEKVTVDYAQISKLLERFARQGQGDISLNTVLTKINTPKSNISYIKELHEVLGVNYN